MNRQILHDPDFYANPLEFNPGRFLGDHPEPDPSETVFGYGRRICECFCFILIPHVVALCCGIDSEERRVMWILIERGFFPFYLSKRLKRLIRFAPLLSFFVPGPGLNLAQSSLWLACAMSLAVFDIQKYVDGFGNVVEPKIHYSDGSVR